MIITSTNLLNQYISFCLIFVKDVNLNLSFMKQSGQSTWITNYKILANPRSLMSAVHADAGLRTLTVFTAICQSYDGRYL